MTLNIRSIYFGLTAPVDIADACKPISTKVYILNICMSQNAKIIYNALVEVYEFINAKSPNEYLHW